MRLGLDLAKALVRSMPLPSVTIAAGPQCPLSRAHDGRVGELPMDI